MKVLNHRQIDQKIERIAIEILERNFNEDSIVLAGINNNGYHFAGMLLEKLKLITDKPLALTTVKLNPAEPLQSPVEIGLDKSELEGKPIIVVDDVANTGRTVFYAFLPLMEFLPKKVEVAVLVDRKHKAFPVSPNYVGLSLATTLNENIDVRIREDEMAVYLK